MNEVRYLKESLFELNGEIESENTKKTNLAKALQDKISLADVLDDKMRTFTQKIGQLEKIEYPGENEREMLVSFVDEKYFSKIVPSERCWGFKCISVSAHRFCPLAY